MEGARRIMVSFLDRGRSSFRKTSILVEREEMAIPTMLDRVLSFEQLDHV
jgi:hypothetical protein